MTPRAMRRAAQRKAVLRNVKTLGCDCKPWIKPGHRDELGIPHVNVHHDDGCRLRHAPPTTIVYRLPGCDR